MKNLFLRHIALIIMLIWAGNALSQTGSRADVFYLSGNYARALQLYLEDIESRREITNRHIVAFRVAECYRHANDYEKACSWYERALASGYYDSTIHINYARMLLMAGNTTRAHSILMELLLINPENKLAQLYMEQCRFASHSRGALFTFYDVKNESQLNTEWNEFGMYPFEDGYLFSSSRITGSKSNIFPVTGQAFERFFYTKWDQSYDMWTSPVELKGPVNSKFNTGTFTFDKNRSEAFFMQCNGYQGKDLECHIFSSIYNKNDKTWTEPKALLFSQPIPKGFSYGHPSISTDGNTLFLVSDMPGGIGGKDIYKSQRQDDGTWSKPENLGEPVNTAADEMFPFIYKDTLLYFASDGHRGYGGLDIFYTWKEDDDEYVDPINLNPPFNSSADDFGIMFIASDSGFFSSNRNEGYGGDDIYSFYMMNLRIFISGFIKDVNTGLPVPNAYVSLSRNDGFKDSTLTDSTGFYSFFSIEPNYNYIVLAEKRGYLSDSKIMSTIGVLDSIGNNLTKRYFLDLSLDLDFHLIQLTKDEVEIPDIFYDFDSWTLRDTSKYSLGKLLLLLNANPELYIIINAHTDERGREEYNLVLSQKRAQSVVEYLVSQGIERKRLQSKGWGKSNPAIRNAETDEEHQMNRRTTFNILNIDEVESHKELVPDDIPYVYERKEIVSQEYSFRIQIAAARSQIDNSFFKKVHEVSENYIVDEFGSPDGYYRYSIGPFTDYKEANRIKSLISKTGFSPFIIAYKDGKIVDLNRALRNIRQEK